MNDRRFTHQRQKEATYSRLDFDKRHFVQMSDGQFFEQVGVTLHLVRDKNVLQKLKHYADEHFQLNAFEIKCLIRDKKADLEKKIEFIKHADLKKLPRDMELELSSLIDRLVELNELEEKINNKNYIYETIKKRKK